MHSTSDVDVAGPSSLGGICVNRDLHGPVSASRGIGGIGCVYTIIIDHPNLDPAGRGGDAPIVGANGPDVVD
jgi:hypothetical protein